MATNGDTHLGGDDIDNLLITIALDDIQGDLGLDVRRNGEIVQTIRKAVIETKIALSSQPAARLDIELPAGKRYQREITRRQFEDFIRPILDSTIAPCKQSMKGAGATPGPIEGAVLVGGATRTATVRSPVKALFR